MEEPNATPKTRSQIRREQRCCSRCGRQDLRTLSGKCRCAICAEKAASPEARAHYNAHRSQWLQARKEAHVCVQCGKVDEATLSGRIRCAECARKFAAYNLRDREKHRELVAQRRANGQCIRCGCTDRATQQGEDLCFRCRGQKWKKEREKRLQEEAATRSQD